MLIDWLTSPIVPAKSSNTRFLILMGVLWQVGQTLLTFVIQLLHKVWPSLHVKMGGNISSKHTGHCSASKIALDIFAKLPAVNAENGCWGNFIGLLVFLYFGYLYLEWLQL